MNDSCPPRSQFKAAAAAASPLFWAKQGSAGPLENVIQQVVQVLNT